MSGDLGQPKRLGLDGDGLKLVAEKNSLIISKFLHCVLSWPYKMS